jgi:hypothetical protein
MLMQSLIITYHYWWCRGEEYEERGKGRSESLISWLGGQAEDVYTRKRMNGLWDSAAWLES